MLQGSIAVNRGSPVAWKRISGGILKNYPRTCLLADVKLIGCRKSEIGSKA